MDQDEVLNKKAEKIEAIHAATLKQIVELQKKQNEIIKAFIDDLKEKRLGELKQAIGDQQ